MMMMMEKKRAFMAVILIQAINAGMFLLSKAALNAGMNHFFYVFYRQATATLFLSPIAFFLRWKDAPPLTFFTFCKIFMLSLFGITLCLNLYMVALEYTSATLAAATANSLPVITFFLALLLRREALRLKSIAGSAKVGGIVLCIGGVGMLAFYKGPQFRLCSSHHLFAIHNPNHHSSTLPLPKSWLKGCLLLVAANVLCATWIVLQASVLKSYPSKLLLTNLQCLSSSFQSFAIAIAMERDPQQWKLGWNLRLLSVTYCGMMTAVTFCLQTWVIEKKGPVYVAMSTPFALIITTFFSAIFLGESITLGSTLGGMLLVGGLYFVLWGKSREQKICEGLKEGSKECNIKGRKITELGNHENAISSMEHSV